MLRGLEVGYEVQELVYFEGERPGWTMCLSMEYGTGFSEIPVQVMTRFTGGLQSGAGLTGR